MTPNREPASEAAVHTALLAGLLSQVGSRTGQRREYQGVRNTRFVLAPGSALAGRPPAWVMAAELVETSRLYARTAARTDPETIERLARHLVTRTYSEPRWDDRRGAAMDTESVTLYGLPLITGRTVPYARVDPVEARALFIRHALVEGQWTTRHKFFHDNQALLAEVAELENRVRRRDVVVGDDVLAEFYDRRIPADVVSARHFDSWWKKAARTDPDLLTLTRQQVTAAADDVSADAFPDQWRRGDLHLPLTYRFQPGAPDDGVQVHIPIDVLNRVDPDELAWPVPARREELIAALLKALPKAIRRELGPAPQLARALAEALDHLSEDRPPPGDGTPPNRGHQAAPPPLLPTLEREIRAQTGIIVAREDWALDRLPAHLRPGFVVEDAQHRVLAEGKDLGALQRRLAEPARAAVARTVARAAPSIERSGLRDWDFEELPRTVEHEVGGRVVRGFPALVDEATSVSIRVLTDQRQQSSAMHAGVRRLLRLTLGSPLRAVLAELGPQARLALAASPDGSLAALGDDALDAVLDALIDRHGGPAWDAAAFRALRDAVRPQVHQELLRCLRGVEAVLEAARGLDRTWSEAGAAVPPAAAEDLRRQRDRLLAPGFVTEAGTARLADLTRYLRAMAIRLSRLPREADVDAARMARVQLVQDAFDVVAARVRAGSGTEAELAPVRWMIEEFRVSVFAQALGTAHPVSEQRIFRALDAIVV